MGVIVPQVVTEDRAGSALIVDGGLRFNQVNKNYLTKTVSDCTSFTLSFWYKPCALNNRDEFFDTGSSTGFYFYRDGQIKINDNTSNIFASNGYYRDPNSFYHVVGNYNGTVFSLYVNGVLDKSSTISTQLYSGTATISANHSTDAADLLFSQYYLIDGQALDPSYFGYTDPLTNTWRPKKFKPQATPNNGTVWSTSGNFSGNVRSQGDSYGPPNMFNGIIGNENTSGAVCFAPYSSNSTCTWTAPTTFTGLTSLRLYVDLSGTTGKLTVNGVDYSSLVTALSGGDGWITIPQSSLSTIAFGYTNGLNDATGIAAVEVNGVILLDNDVTNMGKNAFYLPFDGSAPIGQDQSGRGNNWTPVNFGGSNTIEKATGALPILNTDGGGKVATPGVLGSKIGKTYTVTVPGGTGGGYYLDGIQKPTLNLIRGATYTFDQSDSSNTGHPLVFATIANENNYSDGVTTNGTPGSAGAYTRITVPHNAPDTLYYHCSVHSGMGGSTSQTTDIKKADPYAWKNVLALPLVGIKSDFSNKVNGGTTEKITSVTTSSFTNAESIFYGGSLSMGGGYVTVTDNSDFNFGTGSYTVECWVYITSGGTAGSGFVGKWYAGSQGTTNSFLLLRQTDATLAFVISAGGTNGTAYSGGSIPSNKWVHCTACYDASSTTLRLFVDGVIVKTQSSPDTPATVSRNLTIGRWDIGDGTWSGYMSDVRIYKGLAKYTSNFIPASTDPDILPDTPSGVAYSSNVTPITDGAVAFDGSGDYLELAYNSDYDFAGQFTLEAFVYPSVSTGDHSVFGNFTTSATGYWGLAFDYSTYGTFTVFYYQGNTSVVNTGYVPIPRAWNHYAVTRDASNVIRVFLNGQLLPTTATYSGTLGVTSQNSFIGWRAGLNPLNGFISNVHWVKGTCLYTSNFTPPTAPISSVENTKLLCCKSQSSATAADVTPGTITANGNAAASNFNPFTVNINTQRGKQSGYATWNPLNKKSTMTLSNGNLTASCAIDGSAHMVGGTIGVSNGKWYWEYNAVRGTGGGWEPVVYTDPLSPITTTAPSNTAYAWTVNGNDGNLRNNNGVVVTDYFDNISNGDHIACALDMDNGKVWFAKNGIWGNGGNPTSNDSTGGTGLTGTWYPSVLIGSDSGAASATVNFGQKPFKFPPPAGFQPLALANTPRPTIVRPDQYVGVTTYIGTSGATSVSNLQFKPDLVWLKNRDSGDGWHQWRDSVRGGDKNLASNSTAAESDASTKNLIFNSNGFTLTGTTDSRDDNYDGDDYVAWCWKAGGNSNTFNVNDVGYATASAAGLTAGTITPTGASVNTKSGFSIITYTGNGSQNATISHGLGVRPSLHILKNRTTTSNWVVLSQSIDGSLDYAYLNSTAAFGNAAQNAPTSSVFSVWDDTDSNANGNNYVAYCWAEIPGFSKFGSYVGGSNPFVHLGFRPKFILFKSTTAGTNWDIYDASRTPYNECNLTLSPNLSGSEYNAGSLGIDFLSNGFKCDGGQNSAQTFIYCAFAETPSFNLYGAMSNAR